MSNHKLLLLLAVLILAFCVSLGCNKNDDDDDSGGDDDDAAFQATSIKFTPDGPGTVGQIWLEGGEFEPENNRFTLKVLGDEIENAYGVAGRLEFDVTIASLDDATAGDALQGNEAVLVAKGGSTDKGGVFGVSRSVDFQNSVTLSKDKVIGVLEFTVTAAGETTLKFDDDGSAVPNHDLDTNEIDSWLGGTLKVD
jgi:hypothetical protein